jgi:hypothetical protein
MVITPAKQITTLFLDDSQSDEKLMWCMDNLKGNVYMYNNGSDDEWFFDFEQDKLWFVLRWMG